MRAAATFVTELGVQDALSRVSRVEVEFYGSLALTGLGHMTDVAVMLGLSGEKPDEVDPETIAGKIAAIRNNERLLLGGSQEIGFDAQQDLIFNRRESLELHSNGMTFRAFAEGQESPLQEATYFSVGGGFVVDHRGDPIQRKPASPDIPHPFCSARELLEATDKHECSISDIAWKNERSLRSEDEIREGLRRIWEAMQACVYRGCRTEGILPGGLEIERRAPELFQKLTSDESANHDPMSVLDWVDLFALAVNEENAAGGRVVTAPTNGAAGIIPAVLHYVERFRPDVMSQDTVERFLLTAAVIGSLYKRNASISGAEVGCQGEVGVACSMAAGALTEVLGGTPRQAEEAAEIGMEHNLGLTCDPIKGLVQVPCIERNAMGAVKAINAARMALRGDGRHFVSLDRVIRVMKRTGADMSARYKETSRGGLAVNISEC